MRMRQIQFILRHLLVFKCCIRKQKLSCDRLIFVNHRPNIYCSHILYNLTLSLRHVCEWNAMLPRWATWTKSVHCNLDKLGPNMKVSVAVGFLSLYKCGLRTKDISMNCKLMRNIDSQATHKPTIFWRCINKL